MLYPCLGSSVLQGARQKLLTGEGAPTLKIQVPSKQFQAKLLGSLLLESHPIGLLRQCYRWGLLPITVQYFKEKKQKTKKLSQTFSILKYSFSITVKSTWMRVLLWGSVKTIYAKRVSFCFRTSLLGSQMSERQYVSYMLISARCLLWSAFYILTCNWRNVDWTRLLRTCHIPVGYHHPPVRRASDPLLPSVKQGLELQIWRWHKSMWES